MTATKPPRGDEPRRIKKTYAHRRQGVCIHWWAGPEDRARLERIADACAKSHRIRPSRTLILRVALEEFEREVGRDLEARKLG